MNELRPETGKRIFDEVYGQGDEIGRLYKRNGQLYQVVEVGRTTYWSDDRAHDEDEFDKLGQPGWYTQIVAAPVDETPEEISEREEAAAKKRAAVEEKQRVIDDKKAAWETEISGLVKTDAAPESYKKTGRKFDSGFDVCNEEIELPDGKKGWYVSWIGDMDGSYWLLPAEVAIDAEAEEARLHRVYKWWRPKNYGADSYPGPGVPREELTEEERAEVDRCYAAKYEAVEQSEARGIIGGILGVWDGVQKTDGCQVIKNLRKAVPGVTFEIQLGDEFKQFARGYADSELYSKERDALRLVVCVRVTLPADSYTKTGKLKAAVERKLPQGEFDTGNRFVKGRFEVV